MKSLRSFSGLFLLFFMQFTLVNSQGWNLSTVIKGATVEPQYSAIDNQNNLYVIAHFDTLYAPYSITALGLRDVFLFKISSSGTVLWYTTIGSTGLETAGGITLDDDNNCYVTGTFYKDCYFTGTSFLVHTGGGDIFLAKYNTNGAFQWAKRVGSSSTIQSSADIEFDGTDKLLLTGHFKDSLVIGSSVADWDTLRGSTTIVSTFIAQFDTSGTHVWSKRFLSSNTLTRIRKIDISENGYYFGGYFQGDMYLDVGTITSYTPGYYDVFIYKTDFNGAGEWVRRIRGPGTENFKSLTTDEYDNVYVLGNYNSTANIYVDSTESAINTRGPTVGLYDVFIGKYNRSGILQWFITKGSIAEDNYIDFVVRNNVIYATGLFSGQIIFNNDTLNTSSSTNSDAFVAAFNQIGDPISGVSIVGTGNYEDAGTIVNMDANSRAYVSGYYKSSQIQIGDQIHTSNNTNKSDLFFANYRQQFKAAITDERMVSCNGLSDGMLKATPYFGKPPYRYSWSHNPALDNPVADNLPVGTYTVTITDNNDSITSIPGIISQPAPLAIDATITPVACFNSDEGAIDITVTGGKQSSGYSYAWSTQNGSGIDPISENQSGLSAGDYTVTVRDDNNCSISEDYTITQPSQIRYSDITVTQLIPPDYNAGSVSLTVVGGTGSYTFAWDGPDPFTSSDEDISGLDATGIYELSVTDGNGCTSDTIFTIIDDHTFIAELSAKTDVLCHGESTGSATITVYNGAGTLNFQWSDGINMGSSNIRTEILAGNYTVTISDGVSPAIQLPVEISEPFTALTIVLDTLIDLRCNNNYSGVIGITASGGTLPYSFAWDNGYNGEDLVNVSADEYTLTVTDGNVCDAKRTETIGEPGAMLLGMSVTGEILCHGYNAVSAKVNASGGNPSPDYPHYGYLWDDPGTQTTETAYNLGAGTYHVVVTDTNGCSATTQVEISEPDLLSFTTVLNSPTCPGLADGSIIPTPAGGTGTGYDYIWSNGVYQRFNLDIPAGTYILMLNDANGCTITDTLTLADPDTLIIKSVDVTDATCLGLDDGVISITASGGTGTYEYSSDGGDTYVTNAIINSLTQGDYIVVVKDGNDCLSEDYPVTVYLPETCGMLIYDAFSPNNDDEYNDVWNIGNVSSFPKIKVNIFNLWGKEVFSSSGYGTPWDGTYEGKDLPSGTYYYVIDPGDGSKILTGAVSIVK